jgi:replicative DNA helicase
MAIDIDSGLIVRVLEEGKPAYKALIERGIGSDLLEGDSKKHWAFIQQYTSENGELPAISIVNGLFGTTLPTLAPGEGSATFYGTQVQERRLYTKLSKGLRAAVTHLDAYESKTALEVIEAMTREINQEQLGDAPKTIPVWSLGPEVQAHYERVKSGWRGILTPWDSINESTLGFMEEDLILFVARSGIGKTWISIMIAHCAWRAKKRVLYVTTEMSKMRIALRLFALELGLPYGNLRGGKLGDLGEKKLYAGAEALLNSPGFDIIGGNFDFKFESMEHAIDDCKPDIVVIDGIYLLKTPGRNRQEQAASAFNEVKRLSKKKKIPIVVTSQFNREVKTNDQKTVKAESIALTDNALWISDLVFAMVQTDDNKMDKEMILKQLKVRDGTGHDAILNWDFDMMKFDEQLQPGGGGMGQGDAAGFGPVAGSGTPPPTDDSPF